MNIIRKSLITATALSTAFIAVPSQATEIVLNDIGGVTGSDAELGFTIAAKYWESVLADDVTVYLDVGFSPLNPGILGSTGSEYWVGAVSDVYSALQSDMTSALDNSAVANLEPLDGGALSMYVPGYNDPVAMTGADANTIVYDDDGSINNTVMGVTTAAAKAMGLAVGPGADAGITFSSTFAFDFDPTDGISAGTYDFIGVAVHEIGHALGFTSGTDWYDIIACPEGPYCEFGFNANDEWAFEATDLFRYTEEGGLTLMPGQEAYFSIDGGASEFLGDANFSTGRYNGDGQQASHWKAPGGCSGFIGIMNPYACNGTIDEVTAQDLGLFDAIGWDISLDVLRNPDYTFTSADMYDAFAAPAVPEPAVWAQMLLGFSAMGGGMRFARRKKLLAAAA